MEKSTFVYVTYIRTTPKKLWQALVTPEFQRQYWNGAQMESDWKKGSAWKLGYSDQITDSGSIIESRPPKRLVIKWRNEFMPALKSEGFSICRMDLAQLPGNVVKLTVTHSVNRPKSKLINAVSGGWPFVLSNLKSLLETGKVVLKEYKK